MPHLRNILAVDQNLAPLHVKKSQEKINQRAFPGPGAPDKTDLFARANLQVEPVYDPASLTVVKTDIAKLDTTFFDPQCRRLRPIDYLLRAREGLQSIVHRPNIFK